MFVNCVDFPAGGIHYMKNHLFYLRENRHPVACVAIKEDGANSAFQLSSVSHSDHFDRTKAKLIASGRLDKKPIPIALPAESDFFTTTREVVKAIIADESIVKRTRLAALALLDADTTRQGAS